MSDNTKPDGEPDSEPEGASASALLGEADLETIISEWMARTANLPTPVQYQARWLRSEQGKVSLAMRITPVTGGNVVKFAPPAANSRRKK